MDQAELGRKGEEEAVRYLTDRGWAILGRNVRWGHREVDIIALRRKVLAFVEVKCRRDHGFGHPLEAITRSKREEIARVARAWLRDRRLPEGTVLRFDAVSVLWPRHGGPHLVHVPDAWRME